MSRRRRAERRAAVVRARLREALALSTSLCLACASGSPRGSSRRPSSHSSIASHDAEVVRYRLPLRKNPIDTGEAFRCYGRCQSERSPDGYLECLAECPGFEVTPHATCAKREVPPVSVCLVARQIPAGQEVDPGLVVIAVLANVLIVVGAASLCASSRSQCYAGPRY